MTTNVQKVETEKPGALARKWVKDFGFGRDEIAVEHVFSEGVYTRIMSVPAGVIIVGEIHRHETTNMMLEGELMIYAGDNEPPAVFRAGEVFVSPPGCRKIGLATAPTRIANVHPTTLKDLAAIEKEFIVSGEDAPEYEGSLENFIFQLAGGRKEKCLG